MPPLQKRFDSWLVGLLGSWLVPALHATWRVEVLDRDGVSSRIPLRQAKGLMAFWHRNILVLLAHYRHHPLVVPVSEHRDGEYVAQVMERLGIYSVRGSTTRNSTKLIRGMLKQIRRGLTPCITPDGPRGPKFSIQPGFLLLARRSGLTVYAVAVDAKPAWVLPSWDAFLIPRPFARVAIVIEAALRPAELQSERDTGKLCRLLKDRMLEAQQKAAEMLRKTGH